MKVVGRIFVSGPRGQSYATVQFEEDGSLHPAFAEQALAHALNIYNEMPVVEFDINPDRAQLKQEGKWTESQ